MSTRPQGRAAASAGAHDAPPPEADRPLSELLGDLTTQLSELVRKEVQLAQAEIKLELRRAAKAAGPLGGAGGAGYFAAVMLSFAVAYALAELMPTWVAFLIVGVLYAVAAGVLYTNGRKKLEQINPKPERTVETIKEDAEWAKTRI